MMLNHPNILETIISKYPNKEWDWNLLQENYSVSFQFIIDHCPSIDWYILSQNHDIPEDFIEKNMDKPWDWTCLSLSKISIDFILKHSDKPWDWDELSTREDITEDIIDRYPDKPWNWDELSFRPMSESLIEKYIEKPWNWYSIIYRKNVSLSFVLRHMDINWDWGAISRTLPTYKDYIDNPNLPWVITSLWHNENMPIEFYYKIADKVKPDMYRYIFWNKWIPEDQAIEFTRHYSPFSSHKKCKKVNVYCPNIPLAFVDENIDKKIDWKSLSQRVDLTEEFIEKHIDKPWEYAYILPGTKLSHAFIKKHIDKFSNPKTFNLLCRNKNISSETILEYKDILKNWTALSSSKNITVDLLSALSHKPWKYSKLNLNHITGDFIRANIKKNWNWPDVFQRGILTYEEVVPYLRKNQKIAIANTMPFRKLMTLLPSYAVFATNRRDMPLWFAEQNIDNLCIHHLCSNTFRMTYCTHKENMKRLERAIIPLQKRFLERYYNPNSDLCKARLQRTFNEMIEYSK